MTKLLRIEKSEAKGKKYRAVFSNPDKIVNFGAEGYGDYTTHKDDERKNNYLDRHRKNENWNSPTTPGALSRWILWNKKTMSASIKDFKKRFNL